MAYLIFGGDMLVTAFMVGLVIWLSVRENDERIAAAARIPLDDEPADG
jgi:cbb3-type cytochrome oxidase subunit 3